MAIYLEARFTENGVAKTGLSPTVTVYDLADNSTVINAQSMSEVGGGVYKRDVTAELQADKNYAGFADAGTSAVDARTLDLDFSAFVEINAILADTGELQADLANGGRLDLLMDGIKSKTDLLKDTWNDLSAAQVNAEIDQALLDYDSPTKAELDTAESNIITEINANETKIDTIDGIVDAIKLKTDNLPSDPADQSALEAAITAAESNIRGADSDTLKTVSDQLDTVQADLDNPDQYKADVSALAVEANVEAHATAALSSYDPPTKAELDTAQAAIQADIAALNDITAADILAGVIEGTLTLQQTLRVCLAALAGKSTGGGTGSVAFRDQADSKDRISATVDDDGNRTAITVDGA